MQSPFKLSTQILPSLNSHFHIFIGFKSNHDKSSYYTTSSNLLTFREESTLPIGLFKRIECYHSSKQLAEDFIKNFAVFHTICLNNYDKTKLSRKRKALQQEKGETQANNTRRNISAENFSESCFFCKTGSTKGTLHQCQTLQLDNRVRNIAHALCDTKLLAQLSEGDMVATEAQYHLKCLIDLYNRYRDFYSAKTTDTRERERVIGIALSEVVYFIEETITVSKEGDVPVFRLQELVQMYKEELRSYGLNDIADYVHVTRFKYKILQLVPCLRESKAGKFILLTLDKDLGKALFEVCRSSAEDNGITLAKAAHIIRSYLFENDEIFDGDVSPHRRTNSIPTCLVQLIGLILEGGGLNQQNTRAIRICENIGQLIRFNSVKQKRRVEVNHIRHSTKNEPPLPVIIGLMVHAKTRKKSVVNYLEKEGISISYNRVKQIQQMISMQMCAEYNKDGIVCPPTLHQGIFTTGAIDNIDHDPSSTTSKKSFHGTSISIFQHPTIPVTKLPIKFEAAEGIDKNENRGHLPHKYTDIKPTRNGKPTPDPITYDRISDVFPSKTHILNYASSWTEKLLSTSDSRWMIGFHSLAFILNNRIHPRQINLYVNCYLF